ncbi:MAG: PilZ domain-containing protein [Phycisphaerales bacterium]
MSAQEHGERRRESLDGELELLRELERNTPDQIRQQRSSDRLMVKTKVIVQPGNTSDVRALKVQGMTSDISGGGTQLLLPLPMRVGDTYRLSFDRSEVDLPMLFGRCVRCRLIREEAFESGFAFFQPVEVSERLLGPGIRDQAA